MAAILREAGTQLALSDTANKQQKRQKQKAKSPERSSQSICNSKRLLKDLLACNTFEYFFTITFSPHTAKQYSADALMNRVCNKLADMRENVPGFEHMQYVLIPEPHIDGRKQLHVHGVMLGITDISLVDLRKVKGRKTRYITGRLKQSKHIYTSLYLEKACGYNLFEPIEDIDKITHYLIKMFDLAPLWRNGSKRLVYASHGLERPAEIARGNISSAQLKQLVSFAKSSYKHRSADSGQCFGESFIFDNTLENKAMLRQFLCDEN